MTLHDFLEIAQADAMQGKGTQSLQMTKNLPKISSPDVISRIFPAFFSSRLYHFRFWWGGCAVYLKLVKLFQS